MTSNMEKEMQHRLIYDEGITTRETLAIINEIYDGFDKGKI